MKSLVMCGRGKSVRRDKSFFFGRSRMKKPAAAGMNSNVRSREVGHE